MNLHEFIQKLQIFEDSLMSSDTSIRMPDDMEVTDAVINDGVVYITDQKEE